MELGEAQRLARLGKHREAEEICRRFLDAHPSDARGWNLLGSIELRTGRAENAVGSMDRAVKLAPGVVHYRVNLAAALGTARRPRDALEHINAALKLKPETPELWNNAGATLEKLKRHSEAVGAFDEALALRPDYFDAQLNRANALRKLGRVWQAAAGYRKVLSRRPDYLPVLVQLAPILADLAELEEAIACYRTILRLQPSAGNVHSDLVHMLHYDPRCSAQDLFVEALAWGRRHANGLTARAPAHRPDQTPGRKLRLGYVSSEFRDHPVCRLIVPVLRRHDRDAFTAACYSGTRSPDRYTARCKEAADEWHEIAELSDEALADLVHSHRIDILVDLGGHMGLNRLMAFARKPAPIQVTHFSYPDTTGMSAMDYRITDAWADPPGASERYHTEQLVRLADCAWTYDPSDDSPDVSALPARANGYVTFTSLNKPAKHSAVVVEVWSRVLHSVPGSRLLLLGTDADGASPAFQARFAAHAVEPERLIFVPRVPRREYLRLYQRADIMLDPFPYNGGVTSCDGLWMGLPMVALEGDTYHSRQGLMLLANLGLNDLVVKTTDAYVRVAADLASNPPRLEELRSTLRQRMAASAITDGAGLTRKLEHEYRRMWERIG